MSPALDRAVSPGYPVEKQIGDAVGRVAQDTARYVQQVVAEPKKLGADVMSAAHRARAAVDPSATPAAVATEDELQRRLQLGMNRGEVAFDVTTTLAGGPAARTLGRAADRALVKPMTVQSYLDQGFNPALAERLARPYKGMGSHFTPRSTKQPGPPGFMDSDFNVLAPEGISQGQMYELHYAVDPKFKVARLPPTLLEPGDAKVWSGSALGLKKLGPLGRFFVGMPGPLKVRLGGSVAASGAAANAASREEGP